MDKHQWSIEEKYTIFEDWMQFGSILGEKIRKTSEKHLKPNFYNREKSPTKSLSQRILILVIYYRLFINFTWEERYRSLTWWSQRGNFHTLLCVTKTIAKVISIAYCVILLKTIKIRSLWILIQVSCNPTWI